MSASSCFSWNIIVSVRDDIGQSGTEAQSRLPFGSAKMAHRVQLSEDGFARWRGWVEGTFIEDGRGRGSMALRVAAGYECSFVEVAPANPMLLKG